MPVMVRKQGGKFRVVEKGGNVATNAKGTPVDGGGHATKAQAMAQAAAINSSLRKRGKI